MLRAHHPDLGDRRHSCATEDLLILICVCLHVALTETPGKTFSALPISNAIVRKELPSADTLPNTLLCSGLLDLGTGIA